MSEHILTMKDIIVQRGKSKNVLRIKEFILKSGELVGLIGPNGAGKSTLLEVMNLLLPYQGDFQLFGQEPCQENKTLLRRRSAMVFQDTLLLNDTVFNNVALALRFRNVSTSEIKERVYKALHDFQCAHLAERSALTLSGGEAKRVCIARALVTEPELLLLDEPFAALDVTTRVEMMEELRKVAADRNIAALLVSHDFSEVLNFAQRAVAVFQGSIVQDATPEELLRRPVNVQVARLVGMDNIIPCYFEGEQHRPFIRFGQGLRFLYHKEVSREITVCCIPGDALKLHDQKCILTGEHRIKLVGVVERIIPSLCNYRMVVKVGEQSLNVRVPRHEIGGTIQVDTPITLTLELKEVHLI